MAAKKTTKSTIVNVSTLKNRDEIMAALTATAAELVDVRRSLAQKELTNTQRIKELKKHIAQLKTALAAQANQEEKKS